MPSGSSSDATGATVRQSAPAEWRGLPVRVVSALVIAPPALAVVYVGPPYSDILVILTGGIAAWEWARLCRGGRTDPAAAVTVGAVVTALAVGAQGGFAVAGWLIAAGAMAAMVLAGRRDGQSEAFWLGIGVLYLSAAGLAFLWLRGDGEVGRSAVLWLIAVVWSTDVGAYFAGRSIGGPRLAPSISPKKTWAGLAGGGVLAVAVGLGVAAALGREVSLRFAVLSLALAITSQLGDLFESSLKRRFGAKDSGHLIPGHGGVLDRIDGLLAGTLLLGGLSWVMGGMN